MINCVYGKTMENLRRRINVRLVNNEKYYLKHFGKPTFISQRILIKILLLFIRLYQFYHVTNQFMLDLLF